MSKEQQKQTFNTASGILNSFEGTNATDVSNLQAQSNTAAGQYNSALGTAEGAYSNLNPAGVNSILSPAASAAGGIASTGGYSAPQLNTLESAESSNLGGLDPTALSDLSSQYQDLISSGGISDATAAAMQRQAVNGVGSIYGTLNQQNQRTRAATGGQGGGGETAQLARQLSSAEANAVTGVNSEVGQLRQQGTEAGLSGGSSLAAAQAAAQNAAANTFSGTQSNVAGGLQTGANLLTGVDTSALSGDLASAGGSLGIAGLTQAQQQALQGLTLGTQQLGVEGDKSFLGVQEGIANAPGPFQTIAGTLGTFAKNAGNASQGGGG